MEDNKKYMYWLYNINGIGNIKIEKLILHFKTAKNIFYASEDDLKDVGIINDIDIKNILNKSNINKVFEQYYKLSERGIYFVVKDDKQYPNKLKNIYNAPQALYIRGNLPQENEKIIAIVGARDCSNYGKEMASYFAQVLSLNNISIISGLARGIDLYGHLGALKSNKKTYAVMGCGIDICYPKENIDVYMKIIKNGAIISDYNLGTAPKPQLFPLRNRIISGLSDGIFVIEAKEKSGSLITVDLGLEHGKQIYALPGRVTDILSKGCNKLLKMGAKIVTTPDDILEDFYCNYKNFSIENKKNNKLLETNQKIVYAILSLEPKHIDEIIFETKLNRSEICEILYDLENKGFIKETVKNYYTVL